MKETTVVFLKRIERTKTVVSFRFGLTEPVDFLPGQFVQILFDTQGHKKKELNKYLSFSCAPGKEYLELTKRISDSAFSQRLLSLQPQEKVRIKAPMGTCTYDARYPHIGFLIGGIGITPVISIIEYIQDNCCETDVVLLYSNMKEDDIAFKNELDSWAAENKRIKIFHVVVSCAPKSTECFSGLITKDFVASHMPDYRDRMLYIFGPPGMVSAMADLCAELGCAQEKIKKENFIGY